MNDSHFDVRHKIVGEIHHLLSIASAEDFWSASRMCKSEHIRVALRALADEQNQSEVRPGSGRQRLAPPNKSIAPDEMIDEGQADNAEAIAEFLMNRFPSKAALLEMASFFELDVEPQPKESRLRLALRIGKAALNSPNAKRKMFFERVLNIPSPSETEGWADILRRRNDG